MKQKRPRKSTSTAKQRQLALRQEHAPNPEPWITVVIQGSDMRREFLGFRGDITLLTRDDYQCTISYALLPTAGLWLFDSMGRSLIEIVLTEADELIQTYHREQLLKLSVIETALFDRVMSAVGLILKYFLAQLPEQTLATQAAIRQNRLAKALLEPDLGFEIDELPFSFRIDPESTLPVQLARTRA